MSTRSDRVLIEIRQEGHDSANAERLPKNEGARAVIVRDGEILLLYLQKQDRYVLPGGGVKKDEEPLEALQREVREETGYEVENAEKTLLLKEYFPDSIWSHHMFKAHLANAPQGRQQLTPEERSLGVEVVFLPLEEALRRLSEETDDVFTANIHRRELIGILHSI